jgi:hypothetical protein
MLEQLVTAVANVFPLSHRTQLEAAWPGVQLSAARLGLEIADAERRGLPYRDAIERPDFPLMARMHFGLRDLLQSPLPSGARALLRAVLAAADAGRCDVGRKLLFEIARRRDADGALARFLLFQAIRLNLYVHTWDEPRLEGWGILAHVEDRAEQVLRELLATDELHHPDVRPLHVLIAEMMLHLEFEADALRAQITRLLPDFVETRELLSQAHAVVRALDAADAAVFRPGAAGPEPMGSQRIADRYPHHFASANAVDQRRRRGRRGRQDHPPVPSGERLIDVLLDVMSTEAPQ